jgi:hypothetical protein
MTKRLIDLIDSVVGNTARTVRAVVLILVITVATGHGAYNTSAGPLAWSLRHTGGAITDTRSGLPVAMVSGQDARAAARAHGRRTRGA